MKRRIWIGLAIVSIIWAMPLTTFGQEKRVLQEGEILYEGVTTSEKCDSMKITFILSADKESIKNYTINYYGIYYQYVGSSEIKKITGEASFPHTDEIVNDGVDKKYQWRYPKWQLSLKGFNSGNVTGEFNSVYELPGGETVDLGTVPVKFKALLIKYIFVFLQKKSYELSKMHM